MGDWYTIGLCLGLGVGVGLILAGVLGSTVLGAAASALVGTGVGAVAGLLVGEVPEGVAGGAGGLLGALSAAVVIQGALRRGATRLGIAAYVGAAGVLVLLLALVPVAGYALAVVLPLLAARMRGRQAARYAGLRTLAK